MEIKERRNEKRGAKAEKYRQASLVVKKGNAISAASVHERQLITTNESNFVERLKYSMY